MKSLTILLLVTISSTYSLRLVEKFAWKEVSFKWPSEQAEQDAIKTGRYIPENNLPLGVAKWKNKLFVTVPRFKAGVAAALNYIELPTDEKSPKLQPYPSWETNSLPNEPRAAEGTKTGQAVDSLKDNSTIISTFRIQVDECDRLWVMDTGLSDRLGKMEQIKPNAIVIFDLKTDSLIKRFEIPKGQVKEDTLFANIVVDVSPNDCSNAFAYVADLTAFGVVVYSLKENRSWRVKHSYFHFDPLMTNFNVGGVNFQWPDGVVGMAISPAKQDATRDVYFHALASNKEFVVSNRVLQNETHVNSPAAYYDFKLLGDRGENSHGIAEVYDKATDVIFYTQVNKNAIGCWNSKKPLNPETQGIVDSDPVALIFPNDMKIDDEGTLWVLSDRIPQFLYKSLNRNETNYRIFTGKTTELIKGTPCLV